MQATCLSPSESLKSLHEFKLWETHEPGPRDAWSAVPTRAPVLTAISAAPSGLNPRSGPTTPDFLTTTEHQITTLFETRLLTSLLMRLPKHGSRAHAIPRVVAH